MKINAKLFLISFTIITFVSVTSAFIYHTLTQKLLQDQQAKALINSANDFIFSFQQIVEKIDDEFPKENEISRFNINNSGLDFIFNVNNGLVLNKDLFYTKKNSRIYKEVNNLEEFLKFNTNVIIRQKKIKKKSYYYGSLIDYKILNELASKIRAEVAFVDEGIISLFSNNLQNNTYMPYLNEASRQLREKNNFEIVSETLDNADVFVTHFSPKNPLSLNKLEFLVFSVSDIASTFKSTMNIITATIVVTGILLAIVSLILLTSKFRKQLEYIMRGVSDIAAGKKGAKVKIISGDEIGKLGNAFNNMLYEIEKRDVAEREYTEFISLINKNPTLEKIGNETLKRIVNTTSVDVGALYLYENNELIPFASIGASSKKINLLEESNFYKKAKDSKEIIEIRFTENPPIVKSGIADLKLNYLFLLPVIYNKEVIAIMELASVNEPAVNIKHYFLKIKDQLAIGLANSKTLTELERLVTELKELNEAYQTQNNKVTKQNQELLILHKQLKKGTEELEKERAKAVQSAKLKSEFLANMSHELRTPQNSILGLTELVLKDKSTTPKTKERLNVVLRNGKKLLNLIENILEFSKLESGNIEINKSSIYLDELVNEVKSFVEPLFLEREIEFLIEQPENIPYELNIDIKKVEQIMFNLVGNASKFTKEGFVKLILEVDGKDLIIKVKDSGPGIAEKDMKIIFEEFRQADAELNRKYSGTGLGLAICKRYSELFNGEINVESKLGKGSVFTVKIPNVIKKNENIITITGDNTNEVMQLKAMIISEGKDATKLISDYLLGNNIKVEIPDLEKLDITYIADKKPDLIVVDILMKSKNGWQLLYDLKLSNATRQIPVSIINMDEETNCGMGLNIFNFYSAKINRENVHKAIDDIEELEGIKFRKLAFIVNNVIYSEIENELIFDELKIYHTQGKNDVKEFLQMNEPDLIILDLFDKELDIFKLLNDLSNDFYLRNIPIIAFIQGVPTNSELNRINNNLFENTLINQKNPLEVLKLIKDRIELIDSNIFKRVDSLNELPVIKLSKTPIKNIEKSTGKIKVLITDDDDDARFTIGEIIESLGYKAIYASDGYECLEKLEKEIPDLLLLDIMMPRMDGFQTIKKIRTIEKYNKLKVYALTAYAMLSDKEIIEKNGFNGLFTKPVNTLQIENKLKNIFSLV